MTQKSLTVKEYEDLIRRLKLLSTCQTSFMKHFLHGKLQEGQSLIKKFLEVVPEDQLISDDKIRELKTSVEALKLDQLVVDTHSNEMSMYQEMEILRHSLDSDTGSLAKRLQTMEAENATLRSLLKESASTSADGQNQQKYIETLMKEVSSLKEFIDLKSTSTNGNSEKEIESLKAKLTENEIIAMKEKHSVEIEKFTNELKLTKEKYMQEGDKKDDEIKSLKLKVSELNSNYGSEVSSNNTKALALAAEIASLTALVKQHNDKNNELIKENEKLQQQIIQLEKDIVTLKSTTEIQISSQASAQQSNASLESEIKQLQLKITSLETEMSQIKIEAENTIQTKSKEIQTAADSKLIEVEKKMNADKEATMDAAAQEVEEVEKLKNIEIAALLATKVLLESQLTKSNQATSSSILTVQKQTAVIKKDLQTMNNKTKQEINEMSASMRLFISNAMMNKFKDLNEKLKQMTLKFRKEMAERKKLHNLVQELKGNIRVFLRVRPPSSREIDQYGGEEACCITFPEPQKVAVFNTEKNKEKIWEFDEVFNFESTQEQLFSEVSGLVTSVLDGYNVCIFAYGQTGSGKTWTMSGPSDNRGVNTRSLDELFQRSAARAADYKDTISVNVLEVYNEDIRDLLVEGGSNEKLDIRQSDRGNHVPGLTTIQVEDLSNVLDLLTISDKNRFSRTTNMNEHSSRSHMMLSVNVTSENLITGNTTRGKLNLVDLAGSERINKSGATGQALKEAQNINKSLSALGDVIAARVAKQGHIPFRNSTLTYLLQDSLSQDSKTLMIVCASPILASAEETFCSLNFASRVRTVELGKASRQSLGSGAPTRESSPFPPGSNLSRSTASSNSPATGGATPKQRSALPPTGPGGGLSQNSRDKY